MHAHEDQEVSNKVFYTWIAVGAAAFVLTGGIALIIFLPLFFVWLTNTRRWVCTEESGNSTDDTASV